ncbi:hypothetical protein [Halobacillus sp. H74]|uniref:hypothetical protein n=1 Tax=Halobacillus sp. H74 TaxID=3457436 RepID=UPI003FCDC5A6
MSDLLLFLLIILIAGAVTGYAISGQTGLLLGLVVALLILITIQLQRIIEISLDKES